MTSEQKGNCEEKSTLCGHGLVVEGSKINSVYEKAYSKIGDDTMYRVLAMIFLSVLEGKKQNIWKFINTDR